MINRQIWLRKAKASGNSTLTGAFGSRKWVDTRTEKQNSQKTQYIQIDNIWDDKTTWED